ncbi:enterobactin synthase subunit EntD [Scandinavium sp. NPDC088450]|uniref:enterobactin synthase subunit EntD n=1 Tax=Scandinavium sp. NPDC088450 TaxID=3364514 RepID=UPI0038516164
MNVQHSIFPLANLTLHRIDFQPETFIDADLLWLPHHVKLSHSGRKRKAEHLAGRVAAFYALREQGIRHIADIGEQRQPLWPEGWFGSISHCGNSALAVVSQSAVGLDFEEIFTPALCAEIASGVICPDEEHILRTSDLPFPLALTLAFSAKESLFKALSSATSGMPGFASAQIIGLSERLIVLKTTAAFSPELDGQHHSLVWQRWDQLVVTLLAKTLQFA